MDLLWVRRDARMLDNAALCAAVEHARSNQLRLAIVFVYDTRWIQGAHCHASHCQLVLEGLQEFAEEIRQEKPSRGLSIVTGLTEKVFEAIHAKCPIQNLYSHHVVGDAELRSIDAAVRLWCERDGVQWQCLDQYGLIGDGRLQGGKSVFAKLFAKAMAIPVMAKPSFADVRFSRLPRDLIAINSGHMEPSFWKSLGVDGELREAAPQGGESKARACLQDFLLNRGKSYASGLSSPVTAWDSCSRLSAYLAWGQISLRSVVQMTKSRQEELREKEQCRKHRCKDTLVADDDDEVTLDRMSEDEKETHAKLDGKPDSWLRSLSQFQSRLHWRSHFMQKLHDEPEIATENMARGYDGMRMEVFSSCSDEDKSKLDAWLSGKSGIPFVDACMRALHKSGWINFRMRCMLVSFASYNLWLSWKHFGPALAKLFIDYEPGIHYPQLQMQSGTTGINSNRIYSIEKQFTDHDPLCTFTRLHVPELADLPASKLRDLHTARGSTVSCWNVAGTARAKLRQYNQAVKQDTLEAKEVFQKHGSRRPNAGDLATVVRSSPLPGAKRSNVELDTVAAQPIQLEGIHQQRGVLVQLAISSRSSCRCCQKQIAKGAVRCALEVRVKSRWESRWTHAECFLGSCVTLLHYSSNRKAVCRVSSTAINKGDLIVRVTVGDAKCNLRAEVAKTVLRDVVKHLGLDVCRRLITDNPHRSGSFPSDGDFEEALVQILPMASSPSSSPFKRLKPSSGCPIEL